MDFILADPILSVSIHLPFLGNSFGGMKYLGALGLSYFT